MFEYEDMISERTYYVAKFTGEDLDVISVYRSNIGNSSQLLKDLKILINHEKSTLIVGDFNACYNENFSNPLIKGILSMNFKQLVQQPTHIRGRLIDHAYILNPKNDHEIFTERYSPYFTDHDAICITLRNKKN